MVVPYHKLPLGQQWLLSLRHRQPGEPLPAGTSEDDTYHNWGFRVYRTSYATSSDRQWEDILQKMRAAVEEELSVLLEVEDDDPDARKLLELFRLDIQSDATTLDGLDLEQVRKIHQSATDLQENLSTKEVFLVADQDVLEDDNTWIKCVQADYVAADYIPRNSRNGGQRYFGWMKMGTGLVADLWFQLLFRSGGLDEFAPLTIGGMHLEVWEGTD